MISYASIWEKITKKSKKLINNLFENLIFVLFIVSNNNFIAQELATVAILI